MQGRLDLVIFDCDGVLVDSEIISCATYADVFTRAGFPLTAEDVHQRFLGRSFESARQAIATDAGRELPDDITAQIASAMELALTASLQPIAGVHRAVQSLSVPICVASSSAPERIRLSLSLTGLIDSFNPHIFSATQVTHGKPAPDLFLFAAEQMGIAPERCLVIEDSPAGVIAGKAAGMTVAGFSGGSHCGANWAASLRDAGADMTFATMDAFRPLL